MSGVHGIEAISVYLVRPCPYKIEFLLGITSSRFVRWFWRQKFFDQKKTFPKIKKAAILGIPLPKVENRAQHNALVAHVERMLKLHADLAAAKTPEAQTHLARDIAATDRAIDQLVYRLYDLTDAEIALVEQATVPAVASPESGADDLPPIAPPPPEAYAQAEADAAHHYFAKEDTAKPE